MNFKSLKAALGQAVQTGATYAKDLSSQVVGAKILRDYAVGAQTASGGPKGLWKIHTARCKREGAANALVSVWFLEKKPPEELRHASSQQAWDGFLDLCRKDAANLTRLKHPGIVKLVEPFEETRNQLVLVTEPIVLSLANAVAGCEGLPYDIQQANRDLKMSELERKHGLLQVADTLQFLHAEANLMHCALSPEAIFLTGAGAWKLASLAFCVQVEYAVGEWTGQSFEYAESNLAARLQAPPLNYVAPELIKSTADSAPRSPAVDMFSLGCIAYELLAGRPLMAERCSVADHQARVAGLPLMDLEPVAVSLQPTLRSLLSGTPSVRPSASTFLGAPYFQDDVLVRSLRFLDNILQRDNLQKAAFLKDAVKFSARFDARVLRYKVLPPLLLELRNEALQALVLPLVLGIIPGQDAQDFMDYTFPALLPIVTSAKGEALLIFTRNAALLASTMPAEAVKKLIVPLLVRAADQGTVEAQEEMVKAVAMLPEIVDYEDLKSDLLPRVCGLCLGTTSAAVRTAALLAMGKLLPAIQVHEANKMMAICGKVISVDQTPGTLMCVVGLGSAVARQWGPETGARASLPVMTPCLASKTLTQQQYTTAMRSVREILSALDVQRGGPSAAGSSSGSLTALDAAAAPSASLSSAAAAMPPQDFALGGSSFPSGLPSGSVAAAPGSRAGSHAGSAKSSPRPSAQPPGQASSPGPKANNLAGAFSFADEAAPAASMQPPPSAALASDDFFNFQPSSSSRGTTTSIGQLMKGGGLQQPIRSSPLVSSKPTAADPFSMQPVVQQAPPKPADADSAFDSLI